MTTQKRAGSSRPTAKNQAAQSASAERRRCPRCDRKAALSFQRQDFGWGIVMIAHCRWCHYEKATEL